MKHVSQFEGVALNKFQGFATTLIMLFEMVADKSDSSLEFPTYIRQNGVWAWHVL